MRTPLPVTFRRARLASRRAEADACWREGMRLVSHLEAAGGAAGVALDWCSGYQLGLSRTELRSSALPEAASVQRWLVSACDAGLVVRQELVSMLPAAMVGLQPTDVVLDMCAAPGSKTAQLVEAVDHSPTGGMVLANDVSTARAYVLAHRLSRLACGAPLNLLVVSHRGQRFPRFAGPAGAPWPAGVGPFDRVLCDVPCSGDGTLRKEPSLWAQWRPGLGLALHSLQLQLATRAASLLKARAVLAQSARRTCRAACLRPPFTPAARCAAGLSRLTLSPTHSLRRILVHTMSSPYPPPHRWAGPSLTPPAPSTQSKTRRWWRAC